MRYENVGMGDAETTQLVSTGVAVGGQSIASILIATMCGNWSSGGSDRCGGSGYCNCH